jgi:formylmethanofuran dehydrogenase subunit E
VKVLQYMYSVGTVTSTTRITIAMVLSSIAITTLDVNQFNDTRWLTMCEMSEIDFNVDLYVLVYSCNW